MTRHESVSPNVKRTVSTISSWSTRLTVRCSAPPERGEHVLSADWTTLTPSTSTSSSTIFQIVKM